MRAETAQPKARGEQRILLLPPTSRDAEAIQKVLQGQGIECEVCPRMEALCRALGSEVGAVVVSEEALIAEPEGLSAWILTQPVWSDLPIVVLSRAGVESPTLSGVLSKLGNVSVLERPVRITTLLSVVQSCLRARERQYQARQHFSEREQLLASERF